MGTKLFVGGLSWDTTDASLRAAFERFGEVAEARVILDRDTGRSRGFGFVTFAEASSVPDAMEQMNGAMLDGRSIRVNEAQERGGGGGGRGPRPPRGDSRGRGGPRGGAPPPVVTRGRGPSRPDDRGGRPGGGGGGGYRGRSDRGGPDAGRPSPSFRPPATSDEESAGWGEDRQRTSDRKRRGKKKTAGPTRENEDFANRKGGPRDRKRDSGRSWRDYAMDDEDEDLY